MATYVIGDIQGCYKQFKALLTKINFNAQHDVLWFTGDLVNRGGESLAVLRFIQSLGNRHKVVLGNHDLHLLAVYYGVGRLTANDTFTDVLSAIDRDDILFWLRQQPLLHVDREKGYLMAHAGIAPQWTLDDAQRCAEEVHQALIAEHPQQFLEHMYGNECPLWDDRLSGQERLRTITNYLTRMRYCDQEGKLELVFKGKLSDKPPHLLPWFDVPHRRNRDNKIIFGHWASLGGKVDVPNVYALDTGCVWGNALTAMRLEDNSRISVDCADCRVKE